MANEIYVSMGYYFPQAERRLVLARNIKIEDWKPNVPKSLRFATGFNNERDPKAGMFDVPSYPLIEVSCCFSLAYEPTVGEILKEIFWMGGPGEKLDMTPLKTTLEAFLAEFHAPDTVRGNYLLADETLARYGKHTVEHPGWVGGAIQRWVEDSK